MYCNPGVSADPIGTTEGEQDRRIIYHSLHSRHSTHSIGDYYLEMTSKITPRRRGGLSWILWLSCWFHSAHAITTSSTGITDAARRTQELAFNGDCSGDNKCGLCEGDCDSDFECAPGLTCFKRFGFASIPGCVGGGVGDVEHKDYCIVANPDDLPLQEREGACRSDQPCGLCEGTCRKERDLKLQQMLCTLLSIG